MNVFEQSQGTTGETGLRREIDAAFIVYRLEEAGATLLALPGTGYSTRLKASHLDVVQDAQAAYGRESGKIRPPVPSASRITQHGRGDGLDRAYPEGSVCAAPHCGGALPGEPGDRAASVFVAPVGGRAWVLTIRRCSAGTGRGSI